MNIGDRVITETADGKVIGTDQGEVAIAWNRQGRSDKLISWYTPDELKKWGIVKEGTA